MGCLRLPAPTLTLEPAVIFIGARSPNIGFLTVGVYRGDSGVGAEGGMVAAATVGVGVDTVVDVYEDLDASAALDVDVLADFEAEATVEACLRGDVTEDTGRDGDANTVGNLNAEGRCCGVAGSTLDAFAATCAGERGTGAIAKTGMGVLADAGVSVEGECSISKCEPGLEVGADAGAYAIDASESESEETARALPFEFVVALGRDGGLGMSVPEAIDASLDSVARDFPIARVLVIGLALADTFAFAPVLALLLALLLAPSFASDAFLLTCSSSSLSRISMTSVGDFLLALTGAEALSGFPKRFLNALFNIKRFGFLIGCVRDAGTSSPDEISMISASAGGGA